MPPKVRVGPCSRVWAAVGEGECVPMHGGRDVGLWSPVGKVAIPLLVAGTEVLYLKEKRQLSGPTFHVLHQHHVSKFSLIVITKLVWSILDLSQCQYCIAVY